jgi:hypothetical protein
MERDAKHVNSVKPENRPVVRVVDGVEYLVVSASSGSDWHGRYGRRPQPKLKSEWPRIPRGDAHERERRHP